MTVGMPTLQEIKNLSNSESESDQQQCILELGKFLQLNPDSIDGWELKASCHDRLGQEQEAEPCYQRVYDLGWRKLPQNEQAGFLVGFGSTLRNNLKFQKSVVSCPRSSRTKLA